MMKMQASEITNGRKMCTFQNKTAFKKICKKWKEHVNSKYITVNAWAVKKKIL